MFTGLVESLLCALCELWHAANRIQIESIWLPKCSCDSVAVNESASLFARKSRHSA